MKLKPLAIAIAAGLALSLTGCTSVPDYTEATITAFNPWTPGVHTIWLITGSSVELTETHPGDDGLPLSNTFEYELLDRDAFYRALHRALNANQQNICMDAVEYTVQASDQAGQVYGNNLHQCGDQQEYIAELLGSLDADRA